MQLRKGPEVVHAGNVTEIYAMPHEFEAQAVEKVDLHFIIVGVNREKAFEHKRDLIQILDTYPNPERLAAGPSYIEVGGEIGDQGAAFQLFALGEVLHLWKVITPAQIGIDGELAQQMAGSGFIMISGYHPAEGGKHV